MSRRIAVSLVGLILLAAVMTAQAGPPQKIGKYYYYGPSYKSGYDHQAGYCYGKYQYQCDSGKYIPCYYFPNNYYDGHHGWYYGEPSHWLYHCTPDHTWFQGDQKLPGPPPEPQSQVAFAPPPPPPDLPQ